MNLQFQTELAQGYKSPSQIARVLTEEWGKRNLYCPSCDSDRLRKLTDNTRVYDYQCDQCTGLFQIKSQSKSLGNKILDSAYQPMIQSIKENKAPHLFVLNYDSLTLSARNLLIIPKHFLTLSCIEKC